MISILMETEMGDITATYRGREYIELNINGEQADDIINVFDYAAGNPRIENTHAAVEKSLREWFSERFPEFDILEISHIWGGSGE